MSDEEKKVEEPQEEPKPQEEPVEEPVEKEDPLPDDPNEMDSEQLERAENEMIDEETGEVKEPEEKPAEESKTPEGEEKPPEGEEKPAEETPPEKKYDKDGNEVTGDPLRDTQANLQRERDKRIDAERKLEEERFKGFDKLEKDDEDILKNEDPEGYIIYKDRERDYESHKTKILDDDINDAHQANRDSVINFMSKRLELDPSKPGDQERVISLMRNKESEESQMMVKLDNYLSANIKPVKSVKVSETDAIPIYTEEQLDSAYKTLYHDDILSTREKEVREATLNKIKEAGEGGSVFDRVGKNESAGPSGDKKIDEYSQDEIYSMDEEQTDRLLKQVDTG